MTFLVSWLALHRGGGEYVDVGFIARSPRGQLRAFPLPGFEPSMAELIAVADGAEPDRVPDIWDYLMERGMGTQSSFSDPAKVVAADFEALAGKVMAQAGKVQHLAGEGASG